MRHGKIYIFEGTEGMGKSTLVANVAKKLAEMEIPTVLIREPGGSAEGEAIREVIFNEELNHDPITEVALFAASRRSNIIRAIEEMKAGKIVLMDRSIISSLVWQAKKFEGKMEPIIHMDDIIMGDVDRELYKPKVFFLDMDLEKAIARKDAQSDEGKNANDRLPKDFLLSIGEMYRAVIKQHKQLPCTHNWDMITLNADSKPEALADYCSKLIDLESSAPIL